MAPCKKSCGGYASGSPWRFTGRALYQMHLVKSETARRHVPAQLKLVEAFGYTLGGFYLAHYDDSPVGSFDEKVSEMFLECLRAELVVIAGIVWNPPTSCAWAARVLVNDMEACRHGRKEVGLPSDFALFSQTVEEFVKKSPQRRLNYLHPACNNLWNNCFRQKEKQSHGINIHREHHNPWCHFSLPYSLLKEATSKGPPINFSLPSFSGQTEQQPSLLKYSCDLSCRVSVCKPASISYTDFDRLDADVLEILTSKPLLAISFEDMNMGVKAPTALMSKSDPGTGRSCAR